MVNVCVVKVIQAMQNWIKYSIFTQIYWLCLSNVIVFWEHRASSETNPIAN